LTPIII